MIDSLRCTLVCDGSSDRALLPVLSWILEQTETPLPLLLDWADLRRMRVSPKGLEERLRSALEFYPCELLFVHRDAEAQEPEMRRQEIAEALATLSQSPPAVCVIPVRMTEAWLLFDHSAIRRAADNKEGRVPLTEFTPQQWESLPDPKAKLNELLRAASEKHGRRLDKFRQEEAKRRVLVAERITDFSPLRQLSAFQQLERDTQEIMQTQGWL